MTGSCAYVHNWGCLRKSWCLNLIVRHMHRCLQPGSKICTAVQHKPLFFLTRATHRPGPSTTCVSKWPPERAHMRAFPLTRRMTWRLRSETQRRNDPRTCYTNMAVASQGFEPREAVANHPFLSCHKGPDKGPDRAPRHAHMCTIWRRGRVLPSENSRNRDRDRDRGGEAPQQIILSTGGGGWQ